MERPGDDFEETHNVRVASKDTLFGGVVSRLQVMRCRTFSTYCWAIQYSCFLFLSDAYLVLTNENWSYFSCDFPLSGQMHLVSSR